MDRYLVLARKYRPKLFKEVVGQIALVTTLKNAIKFKKVAGAYLFCGPKGTGKTTLARLFSKALNCLHLNEDIEPCNECASCKAVMQGNALYMLEIDGASNRGIDDIRQLTESVSYVPAEGSYYKVYLIDEVHMLTKEAFNALLKTLEEPPPQVVFFFATTEPHKLPPTILSRCQRFNLQRLSNELIIEKLLSITEEIKVEVESQALAMIAEASDGSLRDAESMLDQALTLQEGRLSTECVSQMLGMTGDEVFLHLSQAILSSDLKAAFSISDEVFNKGKDIASFIEKLIFHFRQLLMIKLQGSAPGLLSHLKEETHKIAALFSQEQCLNAIDLVLQAQSTPLTLRRIGLEALLLRLIRSGQQITPDLLFSKLKELQDKAAIVPSPQQTKLIEPKAQVLTSIQTPPPVAKQPGPMSVSDPTTTTSAHPSRYDTLIRFAAVELEGTVKSNKIKS